MANYKLSVGRISDPPKLPLTGNEMLFAAQVKDGSPDPVTVVLIVSEITGPIWEALAGKQPAGDYASRVHSHTIGNITGLQEALDGKQPAGDYASRVHGHAIGEVTGLQSALEGRVRLVSDGDWITLGGNWLTTNKIRNAAVSTLRWTAPADYTMIVSFPSVDSEVGIAMAATFNAENRFWLRSRHDSRAGTGWERWKPWVELAIQNENAAFKNLTVTGTINRVTGSSRKLKDIDGPLVGALDIVRAIEVVVGRYKADYGDDHSDRAFVIAEQLQEVFPSAVKDGLIEYRGEKVLGVDYEMLITPMIGAVKQLADTVDRQAGMIEALSKRLEKLEGKV